MIVRVWSASVDVDRLAEYHSFARTFSLPMFERQAGFRGVAFIGSPSGARQAAVTLWEDLAAVEGLARSSDYLATADSLMGSGIVRGTRVTEVWATTSLSFFSHRSTP
jgi:hypothetical protein